jgi:uncharacterized protein
MDTKLLELLVCPVTKGPLIYHRDTQELLSRSARLAYPIARRHSRLLETRPARSPTKKPTAPSRQPHDMTLSASPPPLHMC